MPLPTEPIGSLPRPAALRAAWRDLAAGAISREALAAVERAALVDTLRRFEQTGSRVITDGELNRPDPLTYAVQGHPGLAWDGAVVRYADGHARQLPRLVAGPMRYVSRASSYLAAAKPLTRCAMKQSVASAGALSLMFPREGLDGYPREALLDDLVAEAEREIRECLSLGAVAVQIDFSDGRHAAALDPSLATLREMVAVENRVLARFDDDARTHLGVHLCAGSDGCSTHSADVDPAAALAEVLRLEVGRVYVELAREPDRASVLRAVAAHARPEQVIFVGVTDPRDPRVETPDEVCDRVLEAAEHILAERLGTTDDCGFAPYYDDETRSREVAFAKVRARVQGTELASKKLGVG